MKKLLACALLLSALLFPAFGSLAHAAPAGDDAAAIAEIDGIVKAFQAAIIARDRAALEAMFLPTDNSWLTVASDGRRKPGQPRVRPSDYRKFAEFVGATKVPVEERFHNVRIHSNGSVGAVYFDFDFIEDGKVVNKGAESWHLVKTDEGWKISSMVFSLG